MASVITREQFTVTPEAQLAMDRYGFPNPVDEAVKFDIDLDAIRGQITTLESAKSQVSSAQSAIPEGPPDSWAGASAEAWSGCTVTFWDVLLRIWDFIVWFVEALIWFIDLIMEIVRWIANVVDWILGILSIIGAIEMALDKFGVRVPSWIRGLMKLFKLVEKGAKLILMIVTAAAWLIGKIGKPIDQFLDWLRGQLESYRKSIAGCLGTGPDIEDEPIEPPFP